MKLEKHVLINLFVGSILLQQKKDFSHAHLFMIVLGGILIDFDHLLYEVINSKTLSIRKVKTSLKNYHKIMKPNFYFFHTFETLVLSTFLTFNYFPELRYYYIGYLIHFVCDVSSYVSFHKRDTFWLKHWSLAWNLTGFPKKVINRLS